LYLEEGPFFIANLEYIFEASEGLQPYDVWLSTSPEADTGAILQGLFNLGVPVPRHLDARQTLSEVYAQPNRQGMLGMLSVGFLAALLLTAIGFFLNAIFSLRERTLLLGVLRAIGLSARQMGAALALEQILLLLVGLGAGTGIAALTSYLFIPHLPVTFGSHPGTPPFQLEIAWGDIRQVYLIFSLMLLAAVTLTVASLRRMKIFQAVKLGETG
jgi:putative ABC transport system permease protein